MLERKDFLLSEAVLRDDLWQGAGVMGWPRRGWKAASNVPLVEYFASTGAIRFYGDTAQGDYLSRSVRRTLETAGRFVERDLLVGLGSSGAGGTGRWSRAVPKARKLLLEEEKKSVAEEEAGKFHRVGAFVFGTLDVLDAIVDGVFGAAGRGIVA